MCELWLPDAHKAKGLRSATELGEFRNQIKLTCIGDTEE